MSGRIKAVQAADAMSNEELIKILQQRAQAAPEPGDLQTGQVLHRGDDALPAPQIVSSLTSAGYCYIYDTRTGEQSVTNRNMLLAQLEKKREDGSLVFGVDNPHIPLVRGTHKCLLHADNTRREKYAEMGLPTCRKANLTSPYQVMMHMRHRHPQEWAAIEEARLREEKEMDRAVQHQMLQAIAGK